MSNYLELYLKVQQSKKEIKESIEGSNNINKLKKELSHLESVIQNINEEIKKEKELIELDVISKNNITKEELTMPFFEDFGFYMGKKIKINPKSTYIPSKILSEPVKNYIKEGVEKIKEINIELYLKIKRKEKIKIGQFCNINKESKEKLKYILDNLFYFMLFFDEKNNIFEHQMIMEGHFGNPPVYNYINKKLNISTHCINILDFFDYEKID